MLRFQRVRRAICRRRMHIGGIQNAALEIEKCERRSINRRNFEEFFGVCALLAN